jgi:C1q domain-containing protein
MLKIASSIALVVALAACSNALGLNDVTRGEGGDGELDRIAALEDQVALLQATQDATVAALRPVAFRASLATAQAVTGVGSAGTVVAFDKVDLDTHHKFDLATHKYVIPVRGEYVIAAIVGYSGMSQARANCEIWADKQGSSTSQTAVTTPGNSSAIGDPLVRVTSVATMQLDADDRVYVKAFHDFGSDRNLLAEARSTNLQIVRIPSVDDETGRAYTCGYAAPNNQCDNGRSSTTIFAADMASAIAACRAANQTAMKDFCYVKDRDGTAPTDASQCSAASASWRPAHSCCNFMGTVSCP